MIAPFRKLLDQHRASYGNPETGIMFQTRKGNAPEHEQSAEGSDRARARKMRIAQVKGAHGKANHTMTIPRQTGGVFRIAK